MVMEQIANLSTGNRCQGSNPCLSAEFLVLVDCPSGCSTSTSLGIDSARAGYLSKVVFIGV